MPLSNVTIELQTGQLGAVANSQDGTAGLIVTGVAVVPSAEVSGVALNTPYLITSLADAEAMGITAAYDSDNSVDVHRQIREFYSQINGGALLYIMVVANTITLAQMVDKAVATYAVALLNFAQGAIKLLAISRRPAVGYVPTIADGMDADCSAAISNMQALAEEFSSFKKPFRGFVPILSASSVATLKNLSLGSDNAVCAVIGATNNSGRPAVGLFLGKSASYPVQRSIARVEGGELGITESFVAGIGNTIAVSDTTLDQLHDKGYLFFRKIAGLQGWYISSDRTACRPTDDYAYLAYGRVIDKVALLAYSVLVLELNSDLEITTDGKIAPGVTSAIKAALERNLQLVMVSAGELSAASASIDAAQNIIATGNLLVDLEVVPRGYSRSIKVKLGFSNPALR